MSKLALLGGSFDPIHNGHLHIARGILHSQLVESVIFLPNANHNFKKDDIVLDFNSRYKLVKEVIEPGMQVWDDDAKGSGYTADLLKRLYKKYPEHQFFWVIGSDNLASLSRWHNYEWLKENVQFLIIPRPGYTLIPEVLQEIKYQVMNITPIDISSTQIRNNIAAGLSIKGLVPDSILEEVLNLYKPLLVHHT
ncbi:MAG: nicotinate (nicotinamide) nucleotide adenylyltransferase [Candidatus Cloacimonadaceae bacterium]|jgi:nicotinate-nucleotide adenylyltransferase|nr:nicotinate (nicotinamide) nucleotide adenylyltransferase [Candidatus Cloacimonadota bacterium]MCB5258490.1 nicotinate (nicotinamide) nucleotide adenylyltransferase [Candidatus Cloacimonadota bacterium]MDD5624733.1 nicotinate (nicotinamide) nucleotide adenylyltransferase [Candidatus Cloacimonadota bacterium]MDY0111671.1 nicotinate (nicotinamide) nucleotide adenylyltransferase [Candidatus Syntrophosphaera sp.]